MDSFPSRACMGAVAFAAAMLVACKVGVGEGQASGLVWAPDCDLDAEPYELKPNFFAADPAEFADIVDIRMQRGSDAQDRSDLITIQVANAEELKTNFIGAALDLADPDVRLMVRMSLNLGQTCLSATDVPVTYEAVSGTILFDALYVPWVSKSERQTTATFSNVEFTDLRNPAERHANMSGDLSFLFERGGPAQPFP